MMQQRLKAKLMVARWGSEAVPGAGWRWAMWATLRGNEAAGRALRGRGSGQGGSGAGPMQSWGGRCGSWRGQRWNLQHNNLPHEPLCDVCAPLFSNHCRKVNFYDRVHLGACFPELVMALTQFPTATHTHTSAFLCLLRAELSCRLLTGSHWGILTGKFILRLFSTR